MGAGVVCVFVILRSDSEEAAATAWWPAGKGHSDSVVPPAVVECFFGFLLLPRLAARCRGGSRRRGRSGRVWDLACIRFGCKKPQSLLHPLSRIAEFCFRPLLRLRLGAPVFFAVASLFEPCSRLESLRASRHPPPLNMYWVGWGGAQAFPRERITPSVLSNCRSPIPPGISSRGSHLGGRAARTARAGFGVIL